MTPRKKKAAPEAAAAVKTAQPILQAAPAAALSLQAAPAAETATAAEPASEAPASDPVQTGTQPVDQSAEDPSGDNSSTEEPTEPTSEEPAEPTPEEPADPTPEEPTDPTPEESTDPTPEEPVSTEPTPEEPADKQSIAAVMNLCATMITGGYDKDYLREILDALRAQQQITDLQIKVADLENTIGQMKADFVAQMEQAVAEAHAQGEIDGRNAHIEETLQSPEVIPHLVGSQSPRRAASIFDLAATAR